VDGLPRLYGFSSLGRTRDAYVSVGIPKDVAFATADRILLRNLVALGLVAVLVLLAAWFGADLFVLRRVNDLVSATKRLSEGDLGTRTELPHGKGELSDLARAFDQMADSMERLVTERKHGEEEVQRHLQRVTILREINVAITSTLDLHSVLKVLMEKIDLLLPYTAVLVWLWDRKTGLVERAACWNVDEEEWKGRKLRRTPALVQQAIESKKPAVVRDVRTDPRTLDPEFYRKQGLISYLGVPLIVKGEVLGVLVFLTREEHEFSEEEIEFLSTVAGQAAIAIYNSQLHEQTKNQAVELEKANKDLERRGEIQKLLKELSQDITSMEIESLVKKLTEKVREFFKVDVCDVRLVEEGRLISLGVSGIEPDRLRSHGTGTPRGQSKWIIENRRPLLVPDATDRSKHLSHLGFRSYLGIPLFARSGEVIAILRALSYEPREFTQEEMDLFQLMANGCGVALESARLVEQIKNQAVELEKANKVKGEFLGFVSHELKTPVGTVMGYTEMLKDGVFGETTLEQRKTLEKVTTYCRDLVSMIDGLLQATRIEAGAIKLEREEVAVIDFLDELKLVYSVPLNRELALTWDYPSELPAIKTDREKLKHILQNLISNAIKYTDKGNVTISVRVKEGGSVEFTVEDTGIGIPEELLPVIFEMFRQADRSKNGSRGGVGLGLHIVKKFTELLGGTVEVESEVGKGSTFTVTVPCDQ
jgi:signal transduction histidine kinase/HAMP domain-containing protein